jgi:hypothetical protein
MSKKIQTQAKSIASKGWDITLTVTGAGLAVGGVINAFNLVKNQGSTIQIVFSIASAVIGLGAAQKGWKDLTTPKVVAVTQETITEGGEDKIEETITIAE